MRFPQAFGERLLAAAHSTAGVEELFAFRLAEDAAPARLASSSGLDNAENRTRLYARRFHRSDPAMADWRAAKPGSGFLSRVPATAIQLGEYRRLCFERPRFVEKVCFVWRKPDHSLVVTFCQRHEGERDLARLGALAQIAITALARMASRQQEPLVQEVERRLASSFDALTPRERAVCARTLAGLTARHRGGAWPRRGDRPDLPPSAPTRSSVSAVPRTCCMPS